MKIIQRRVGLARLSIALAAIAPFGLCATARAQQPGDKKAPNAAPKTLGVPAAKPGFRTLTINVPQPGDYFIRLLPSADAKDQHPLPLDFKDKTKTFTFDAASLGKTFRIAVDDAKTGNTAIIPPAGRPSTDGASIDLGK